MTSMQCLCGVMMVLLTVLPAASASQGGSSTSSYDRYRVLTERNIFSRDRGQRREAAPKITQPTPPSPERCIVLKGIAQQGQDLVAFLEDTRTGVTTRARTGDSVARGRLKNITLDRVEYELEERVTAARIGEGLTGAAPASETGPVVAPAAAGKDSEAAILERMRQKRREELGE